MTQKKTVANLTAAIRRTTGATRDNYARELTEHVPLDFVCVLVGASDRYHAAQRYLDKAEATLARAMDAARKTAEVQTDITQITYLLDDILTTARTYVISLNDGIPEDREQAQKLFIEATTKFSKVMAATDDGASAQTLAWAAMSAAMAEQTERAVMTAYRYVQTLIQSMI